MLAACAGNTKGVDSTASSEQALEAAQQLAAQHKCVVAVSGATDLVRAATGCAHVCVCVVCVCVCVLTATPTATVLTCTWCPARALGAGH
jgi:hydroxyethylthiazole kinase-like sugar kinase family protein